MEFFVGLSFILFFIANYGAYSSKDITKSGCTELFQANSEDCTNFFVCLHGRSIALSCPPGLHWNKAINTCDWPQNANCGASISAEGEEGESPIKKPIKESEKKPSRIPIRKPTKPANKQPISPSPELPPNKSELKVVCYFTNWAWYRKDSAKYVPEDIDGKLCTHIVYAFSLLDSNSLTMISSDTWADIDNKFYERVTAYRQKGIKVLIAIGGWNESQGDKYGRLLSNESARKNFITNMTGFVQKYNFDGLDLDLEYPGCWQNVCEASRTKEKDYFAQFVKEISEAFKPLGLLLSAAVSANEKTIDVAYDVPKLAKYLDWIALMTYDYHGSYDGKTGHNAPLYSDGSSDNFNVNYTAHYWMQSGAPSKKLILGVPAYGQSFKLANSEQNGFNATSVGGGTAGPYSNQAGILMYNEICENNKNNGWSVVHNDRIGSYAYKGDQWVSFDDVEDIRAKAKLIHELNLGGGMIWALDQDDFTGKCGDGKYPILTALNQGLGRNGD